MIVIDQSRWINWILNFFLFSLRWAFVCDAHLKNCKWSNGKLYRPEGLKLFLIQSTKSHSKRNVSYCRGISPFLRSKVFFSRLLYSSRVLSSSTHLQWNSATSHSKKNSTPTVASRKFQIFTIIRSKYTLAINAVFLSQTRVHTHTSTNQECANFRSKLLLPKHAKRQRNQKK